MKKKPIPYRGIDQKDLSIPDQDLENQQDSQDSQDSLENQPRLSTKNPENGQSNQTKFN